MSLRRGKKCWGQFEKYTYIYFILSVGSKNIIWCYYLKHAILIFPFPRIYVGLRMFSLSSLIIYKFSDSSVCTFTSYKNPHYNRYNRQGYKHEDRSTAFDSTTCTTLDRHVNRSSKISKKIAFKFQYNNTQHVTFRHLSRGYSHSSDISFAS